MSVVKLLKFFLSRLQIGDKDDVKNIEVFPLYLSIITKLFENILTNKWNVSGVP